MRSFDTVKVFLDIKSQLSEKFSNMSKDEILKYLATYNEEYYKNSVSETREKYKTVFDEMSLAQFAEYLNNSTKQVPE